MGRRGGGTPLVTLSPSPLASLLGSLRVFRVSSPPCFHSSDLIVGRGGERGARRTEMGAARAEVYFQRYGGVWMGGGRLMKDFSYYT